MSCAFHSLTTHAKGSIQIGENETHTKTQLDFSLQVCFTLSLMASGVHTARKKCAKEEKNLAKQQTAHPKINSQR